MEGKKIYESYVSIFSWNVGEEQQEKKTIIFTTSIPSLHLRALNSLKRCSKQEFAVLTLITGSSKILVEMSVEED